MIALLILSVCFVVHLVKKAMDCQTIGSFDDKTNPYRDISVDEFNAHLHDNTLYTLSLAPSREVKK